MEINQADPKPGLSGALRAIGVIAVVLIALIGILFVMDVIPREALQEWFIKAGLVLAIIVGAAVALRLISKTS